MEVLQWVFIIGISLAIISVVFFLYFLFSLFGQSKQIKALPQKKSRSKRKRKRAEQKLIKLKLKRKRLIRSSLCFFFLTLGFAGGSAYVTYYQATNLSAEDTKNIMNGYYYISDLEKELLAIQEKTSTEAEGKQTITYVTTSLAGYASKKASTLNTVEGQSVLNRYYSGMSELGINVSRQAAEIYGDDAIVAELLSDMEKIIERQKKAFAFFKIDESVLESKK